MDDPIFFVAPSITLKAPERVKALAAWIGGEPIRGRPLPADRPGLVITHGGLRLHVPGADPTLWHQGMTYRRVRLKHTDTLVRVLDLRPGERVVDGTLGMGHDARMLARAGANVLGLEARPAVVVWTLEGLRAEDPEAARRLTVCCADHRQWFAAQPPRSADHVYLDPMFPAGAEGVSTNLAPFRKLPRLPRVSHDTLRAAYAVCRRRLLLKLADDEPAPWVPGLPAVEVVGSKRLHFALWRTPEESALQSTAP